MPFNDGCNPDNVLAKLMAGKYAKGAKIEDNAALGLDNNATGLMHDLIERGKVQAFEEAPFSKDKATLNGVASTINKWLKVDMRGLLTDFAYPSDLIGKDIPGKVDDFLVNFAQKYDKPWEGRQAYQEGMDKIFSHADKDHNFTPAQQQVYDQYKNIYSNFNSLFGSTGKKSWLEKRLDTTTSGIINLNPTVMFGHIFGILPRMLALYPEHALEGLVNAYHNGGLFKMHPELADQGIYGLEFEGQQTRNLLEKITGASSIPMKNIAYYAGLAEGGTEGAGRYATQQVAFTPRLGDLPLGMHRPVTRSAVRMLNWTISGYRFLGGLVARAVSGDVKAQKGLAYYAASTALLGGLSSTIPDPITDLIGLISPDAKQFIKNSRTPLTPLVDMVGVNRIGIIYDIFSKAIKDVKDVTESGNVTDPANIAKLTSAFFTLFSGNPYLTNTTIKKAVVKGVDVAKGEETPSDWAKQVFVPYKWRQQQ